MACGVPAVAFDSGGIHDAVIHKETGYLAKYGVVHDLADGIRFLLDDKAQRKRIGEQALVLIKRDFTCEREVESFAKIYRTLMP
jgi:glycosyltransferase involved in cell wall biosynthesis